MKIETTTPRRDISTTTTETQDLYIYQDDKTKATTVEERRKFYHQYSEYGDDEGKSTYSWSKSSTLHCEFWLVIVMIVQFLF